MTIEAMPQSVNPGQYAKLNDVIGTVYVPRGLIYFLAMRHALCVLALTPRTLESLPACLLPAYLFGGLWRA